MRGIHALYATTAVTAACTVGLIVVAMIGRPVPAVVASDSEPVYAVAVATTSDHNQPAVVHADLSTANEVLSSGGAGLVTSVAIHAGSHLDDGSELYTVNGTQVHAIVGDIPLYRPLSLGDAGPDVALLQRFLSQHTTVAVAADGKFGPATAAAVRSWQRDLGLPPNGVADPAWFVRLDAPGDVATVQVATGKNVPGVGDVVATLQANLSAIDVRTDASLAPGEYVVLTSSGRTGMTFNGSAWTPADPNMLLTMLQGEGAPGGSNTATGSTAASATGSEPGVSAVEMSARIALATPVAALTLAPGALIASESGIGACAWVQTTSGHQRVEGIVVEGTTASGAVLVQHEGLAGQQVLLDPASFVEDSTCP